MGLTSLFCAVLFVAALVAPASAGAADTVPDGTEVTRQLEPTELPYLRLNGLPVRTGFESTSATTVDLGGTWAFREDPRDTGVGEGWWSPELDRSAWRSIAVPGTWDLAFSDELFGYQGPGWYARTFEIPSGAGGAASVTLRFEGVFLTTDVWMNGTEVGHHDGGYTPFEVDATGVLAAPGPNTVVLRVDNRITRDTIPVDTLTDAGRHGWWPYGGITRDVTLQVDYAGRPFKLDLRSRPLDGTFEQWALDVAVGVHNTGAEALTSPLSIDLHDPAGALIATLHAGDVTVPPGEVAFRRGSVSVPDVRVWGRGDPLARYTATARLGASWATDDFGFRTISVDGGDVLLNGEPQFLRGISRHEDHETLGPVQTPDVMDGDLALLRDLGVNHIRPGHYTANPDWLARLGRAGITVTEEIPVYQLDIFSLADWKLLEVARVQLIEMIERDRNEPAVLVWSAGNEVMQFLPSAGTFFGSLARTIEEYDDTRLTTYAALTIPYLMSLLPDHVTPLVDIVSANQYYGWYYPFASWAGFFTDLYRRRFPDKPFLVSEFGAGALAGRRLDRSPGEEWPDRHSYSEDFQAWFLEEQFRQLLAIDGIDGTMPWVFADFRMQWEAKTRPHPVPRTNLKGLVSADRTARKLAFETLREIYRTTSG